MGFIGGLAKAVTWPFVFAAKHTFTWGNRRPRRLAYAVGCYTIGYGIYDMTWASIQHRTREPHPTVKRYGANTWVVISGATDSVGTEFANRFGDKGFNLILID